VTLLILGGVVLGVAVIVLAVSALKGGGKPSSTVTQSTITHSTAIHKSTAAPASNPSQLSVAVLNGTSTNDLAHHLAADLQQSGYTRAEASSAVPPGTHATTVVQYTPGHRADGQAVAKALNVTRVQPIEASTSSLASRATVVVLAGADQAAQLGGGGAQSTGEPGAGSGGEAGGASSNTGASGSGGAAEGAAGSGQ
jgi:LytR cell envelope-related transcriptional attenuator